MEASNQEKEPVITMIHLHELTLPPSTTKIPYNVLDKFNGLISDLEDAVLQLSKSDLAATKSVYNLFNFCGSWFFKDDFKSYRRLIIDKLCECGFVDNAIRFCDDVDKSDLFKRTFFGSTEADYRCKILRSLLSSLCNFSDSSSRIGSDLANKGIIPLLLSFLKYNDLLPENLTDSKWNFVNSTLGIIGNIARLCPDSRQIFRENNAVEILLNYSVTTYKISKADCYLTISFLITDDEVDLIKDSGGTITFLIDILSKALKSNDELSAYGYSPVEILLGLNNLALNDNNKVRFVQCGGLKFLSKAAGVKEHEAIYIITAEVAWKLAFITENRQKIKDETKLIKALKSWQTSQNPMLKRASSGALWEIFEGKLEEFGLQRGPSTLVAKKPTQGVHVMLSYQWDVQPTMIKLKKKLKRAGYNVWMDVERMEGDILGAMAAAVENAAVLLIGVSKKYKDSNSCRTEATYAYKQGKPIIPLIVEPNYVADGWLGALIGTLKYFKVTCDSQMDSEYENIQKEIGNRGQTEDIIVPEREVYVSSEVKKSIDEVDNQPRSVSRWTQEDVRFWLIENKLEECTNCMEAVNGELLVQMVKLSNKAPDFFYSQLKSDFKMNLIQVLKIANAFEKLKV